MERIERSGKVGLRWLQAYEDSMKGNRYVSHCIQRVGCRQGLHPNMCQELNKTKDQGKTRSEKSEIKHKEF